MLRILSFIGIFAFLAVSASGGDAVGQRIRIAKAQIVEILNDREAIVADKDQSDVYLKIVDYDFSAMADGDRFPGHLALDVTGKWDYITDSGKKTSYVARPVKQEQKRHELFVVATPRPEVKERIWHVEEEPKFRGTLCNANHSHVKIRAADGETRVFERSRLSSTSNQYVDRMLTQLVMYRNYRRSQSR